MKTKPKERNRRSVKSPSWIHLFSALFSLGLFALPLAVFAQALNSPLTQAQSPSNFSFTAAFFIGLSLILNMLSVASHTALDHLRQSHLKTADKEDSKYKRISELFDQKEQFSLSCNLMSQLMRTIMTIACFLPAPQLADWFSKKFTLDISWGLTVLLAVCLLIPVIILNQIIAELLPGRYAAMKPYRVLRRLERFVRVVHLLMAVPNFFLASIGHAALMKAQANGNDGEEHDQAEEDIKTIVETAEQLGAIPAEEKKLIHSVFEFGDTIVREIMTPRIDMDAVSIDQSLKEVIDVILESGRSRIPVYEETDDQIVGIVHAKDVLMAELKNGHGVLLSDLLRPALFVPENKSLHELLREMKLHRTQLAVVQDEFGGTAGLVTMEDIVEELVGEIVDEHDTEGPELIQNGHGFMVQGKMNLDDLNEEVGSHFDSEEFDTIGGYVFGLFGRQPKKGESIEDGEYRFTVDETDGRRIVKLHVEKIGEAEQKVVG